jgi:hypothetical protein
MRKLYSTILLTSLIAIVTGCSSNGMQKLSIQQALADTRSNTNIDPNIRLSFGDNGGSGKLWTANKKTNSVNKEIDEGCNRAFASAVIALQQRARKEGKTSVVDIHSYYKRKKFSSSTQFDCESGAVMSGVALRGRVQ